MNRTTEIPIPYRTSLAALGVLAIAAIVAAILFWPSPAVAQVSPDISGAFPVKSAEVWADSQLQHTDELGIASSDGVTVWVTRTNGAGGTVVSRAATAAEIEVYNEYLAFLAEGVATENLTGQQEGVSWSQFIANRTAALTSCETDMQTGQASDFAALGDNGQNLTIQRMQECIELNSKNGRQLVNYLFDLLVERGIIEP